MTEAEAIAGDLRVQADISDRPGQYDDLNRLADRVLRLGAEFARRRALPADVEQAGQTAQQDTA